MKPQIGELVQRRDRTVADWRARNPGANVFEDRDLEVTSYLDFSIEEQIRAVGQAMIGRG